MATDQAERQQHTFPIGPEPEAGAPDNRRQVVLNEPTEGQMMVLLRLVDLGDEDGVETVQLFGDVVEQMMEHDADRRWSRRAMIRGEITPEDLANFAIDGIRHFYPEQLAKAEAEANRKAAPRTGPTRRPAARRR